MCMKWREIGLFLHDLAMFDQQFACLTQRLWVDAYELVPSRDVLEGFNLLRSEFSA